MSKTYTLRIERITPKDIPSIRIARYLLYFSQILGHASSIHFLGCTPGSFNLEVSVDPAGETLVAETLDQLSRGMGTSCSIAAINKLNRLLANEDRSSGYIFEDSNPVRKIIEFKGVNVHRQEIIGPITQEGSLDGILTGIVSGKSRKIAKVHLDRGKIKYNRNEIEANHDIARDLVKHLFEYVRVFGTESRSRNESGIWQLKKFRVTNFDVLKTDDLLDVMEQMQAIEGSEWKKMEDPIGIWQEVRHDSESDDGDC